MLGFLRKPTNWSFRRQLLTFVAIGSLLVSFTSTYLVAMIVSEMAQDYLSSTGQQVAKGLAKQSILSVLTESGENAQTALQQINGFPNVIAAAIYLADGELLVERGYPRITIDPSTFKDITEAQVIQNTDLDWVFIAPIRVEASEEESEFELNQNNSQILGYSLVKLTKQALFEANNLIMKYALAVGAIAAVVFSFFLNVGLSRLTLPLMRLAKVMEESEQTGAHIFAQIEGAKEVQMIATTYNRMMEVLDTQDEELRMHRDQLEMEVDLRIRELIEARDQALTASRHKSEFLANMSHELRTPIQAIIGYVDLVKEELEVEGLFQLNDDLNRVTKNSQRLLYLINSILDFAKIEAGKMGVKLQKVHVRDLMNNVTDTIQPLLIKNHNKLSVVGKDTSEFLFTDGEKLEQILVNLLSNACKFTEQGMITFEVKRELSYLIFSVKDTGIGIDDEALKSIFEEFQQVDGSQSRKFQGTGLGLAISKRFCELLNGDISVTSSIGVGSEFIVEIPIGSPQKDGEK